MDGRSCARPPRQDHGFSTGSTTRGWGAKGQYLHVQANWQLIVDNLLDLTHLAFVHETTIGNSALVDQAQVKVQRAQDNVTVSRWIIDAPAPPTFVKAGGFTANVDRWQIINFAPPAFLRLDVGATPCKDPGAPEGRRVGRHRNVEFERDHAGNSHPPATISGDRRTISTSAIRRPPT